MSRLRILLAAILCVSLFTFAGCGGDNNTDTNSDNGTVTEENTDMNNSDANDSTNGDDSMMEDVERGADNMMEGLENDAKDAADGMRNAVDGNNGEGPNNRNNSSKESRVGQ